MNSQSLHEQLKPKEYQEWSGDDVEVTVSQILWGTPRPTKKPPRAVRGFVWGGGSRREPRAGVSTVSPIKVVRVKTVLEEAIAVQLSLLAAATCGRGAPPAGRQRPVGRFERIFP